MREQPRRVSTATGTRSTGNDSESRVLVLNPVSGREDHTDRVYTLADEHGFVVRETQAPGDGVDIAREAASADLIAAAGGDGTINEVVRGLRAADALADVTVTIIPTGTGNNFAGNIGIQSVEQGFDVVEHGETRQVDLGLVYWEENVRPFLNSCIGGLTANASANTSPEMKTKFGALAYVLRTAESLVSSEAIQLHIETGDQTDESWTGDAVFVLIGNGRQFPADGRTQANMEDGQFDITIIEEYSKPGLIGEAAVSRLLGGETAHITRFSTPMLSVTVQEGSPAQFSLDGEMIHAHDLTIDTEPTTVPLRVGNGYEPGTEDD